MEKYKNKKKILNLGIKYDTKSNELYYKFKVRYICK